MTRFFLTGIFFCQTYFVNGQVNLDSAYALRYSKSIQDSVFVQGDLIRGTDIIFPLAHNQVVEELLKESLKPYIVFFQKNRFLICELIVHTSARGNAAENQVLSLKRANQLVELMLGNEYIFRERIIPVGKGETQPLFTEEFIHRYHSFPKEVERLHQANERVEIKVKGFLGVSYYQNNRTTDRPADSLNVRNPAYYEDLILIADKALLEGNYNKALEYYSYAADVAPAHETYAAEQRDKIKALLLQD